MNFHAPRSIAWLLLLPLPVPLAAPAASIALPVASEEY
jgi:hypothetical protein